MNQEKAYLEAFNDYADALYRHCYFRVSDPERAKDIVSDTFTRTWDYLVKGNKVKDFRPFLYRTLNRLIIDEYRKKKSESLDAILDEHDVPDGAFEELVDGGKDDIELKIDSKRIPMLLEQMPEKNREVVVMRYLDGLMPVEISDIIGEPVNTISVRIHRGVEWLKENADSPVPYKKMRQGHKSKYESKE